MDNRVPPLDRFIQPMSSSRHALVSTFLLIATVLLSQQARAECPGPQSTLLELHQAIESAQVAYVQLDADGFQAASGRASAALDCVDQALSPPDAAAYHRLQGLRAYLNDDRASVVKHFQSARAAEPDYLFSEELAPPNHPVRSDYELAGDLRADGSRTAPPPATGQLVVDGKTTTEIPTQRPYIFQWIGEGGAPKLTAHLSAGIGTPTYPILVATVPETDPPDKKKKNKKAGNRTSRRLLTNAGIGAVVGGALYGLAGLNHAKFNNDETALEELQSVRTETNALIIVAGVVGVVSVGVGVSALVVWDW